MPVVRFPNQDAASHESHRDMSDSSIFSYCLTGYRLLHFCKAFHAVAERNFSYCFDISIRVLTSDLLGARIRFNLAEQLIARLLFLRCPTEVRSLSCLKSPGNIRPSRPYRPGKFVLPRKGDTT